MKVVFSPTSLSSVAPGVSADSVSVSPPLLRGLAQSRHLHLCSKRGGGGAGSRLRNEEGKGECAVEGKKDKKREQRLASGD